MHHSPVTLRKVDPESNMQRQYTVSVTCDLFGAPLVICRWGRIGTAGQVREYECATREAAEEMALRLLDAKKRRGYGVGTAMSRPVRVRKPSANQRRQALSSRQLWLPGFDISSAAAELPATIPTVEQAPSAAPRLALPKHLADLTTVTKQRRAPLSKTDRERRLSLTIALIRSRGMPVSRGCARGV